MREIALLTDASTSNQPSEPSRAVPAEADADFLRHSRALASQRIMTRREVLQFTVSGGDGAISHW